MAAPRATQFIALRNLARGSQQVRSLSMTGPKTFASPVLERPVFNLPRDIAGLRAECARRNIGVAGHKQDLVDRLNAHELIKSRAFSTALRQPERPSAEQQDSSAKPAVRHFNTSRELKAVKDTSTIDFTFLPDLISPEDVDVYAHVRVPIIPTGAEAAPKIVEQEAVVMKPEINVMSADAVFLPMSESSDGHAMNIDFHAMAETVAASLRRMKVPVDKQAGLAKQIWGDMVDDVMGLKKTFSPAA